jgi:hypothetical protein
MPLLWFFFSSLGLDSCFVASELHFDLDAVYCLKYFYVMCCMCDDDDSCKGQHSDA